MSHRGDDDLDDFFGRPRATRLAAVPDPPVRRSRGGRASSRPPAARPEAPRPARSTRTTRSSTATRATGSSTTARTNRSSTAGRPGSRPAPRSAPRPTARAARPAVPVRPVRPARRAVPPVDGATAMRRTRRRMTGFVVVIVLLVVAVTAKLIDVQASQRSFWVARGESARDATRTIPADRGAIHDRNGRVLALSVSRPNVVVDPSQITPAQAQEVADVLAPIVGAKVADLREAMADRTRRYRVLAPAVDAKVEEAVAEAIDEHGLPAVVLEPTYVREYPAGDIARSLVGRTYENGHVGDDGTQGRYGIERSLDDRLTGTPGLVHYEQDAQGNTIAGTRSRTEPAVPGNDVYLTIDASLQYATQQALIRQVEATGAEEAMAVITRPSTGDVLAMASVARQDDGTIATTSDNRAVTTVFEPGSVNKIITVAGALEDGLVDPDTILEVPDNLTLYDHTFTDHDPHPPRAWSITDILVTSSNIGTIKVAQQLGKARVDHYLRAFGLGHRTGTQVAGEVNGLMLDPDDWSGTSIGSIPIGQGISVTALQMLTALNAVANDGVVVTPRILASVDRGSGKVDEPVGRARRVLSTETAAATRTILSKVVAEGTGSKAAVPGYTAYGKTGTPRIPQTDPTDPTDAYRNAAGGYDYQPVFLGGIEGADLSIIVTVREPKTSIYGGEVAAPLFSELAEIALRTLGVVPPALVGPAETEVPALSSTAKEIDAEGPASGAAAGQG